MKDGLQVRGLNTAATLWYSAAIGILTGSGFVSYAIIGTLFILTANIFLRHIPQSLLRTHDHLHNEQTEYQIKVIGLKEEEEHIRSLILHQTKDEKSILLQLESSYLQQKGLVQVLAQVVSADRGHSLVERELQKDSAKREVSGQLAGRSLKEVSKRTATSFQHIRAKEKGPSLFHQEDGLYLFHISFLFYRIPISIPPIIQRVSPHEPLQLQLGRT